MFTIRPALVAAFILAGTAMTPALAQFGEGRGGDREPAGGAFMSSYPERSSTGIPEGGTPRSVDIPRSGYQHAPDTTGSITDDPRDRRYTR